MSHSFMRYNEQFFKKRRINIMWRTHLHLIPL